MNIRYTMAWKQMFVLEFLVSTVPIVVRDVVLDMNSS